jgi:hypothetical protein
VLQATLVKVRNRTGAPTVICADGTFDDEAYLNTFGTLDSTGEKRLDPSFLLLKRMWAIEDFRIRDTGDAVSQCCCGGR